MVGEAAGRIHAGADYSGGLSVFVGEKRLPAVWPEADRAVVEHSGSCGVGFRAAGVWELCVERI